MISLSANEQLALIYLVVYLLGMVTAAILIFAIVRYHYR